MKNDLVLAVVGASVLLSPFGCGRVNQDGPPTLLLGDTVCDECGMIVSDERFATATTTQGVRGPEPRMFDDFNCQKNFERANPGLAILERWSHDYMTMEWGPTEDMCFLRSRGLRTPMGSGAAAFLDQADAEGALLVLVKDQGAGSPADSVGQVIGFADYWGGEN